MQKHPERIESGSLFLQGKGVIYLRIAAKLLNVAFIFITVSYKLLVSEAF